MNWTSISIGPVPHEENCAQLGQTPDFDRIARLECAIHRAALVAMFGPPPDSVAIKVRSNPHDFGCYYDLEARFDPANPEATAYVLRLEDEGPGRWHEAGFTEPFVYGDRSSIVHTVHSSIAAAIRAAILTLGQFPDTECHAAMRANLLAAFPAEAANLPA
ncbi:hypothetical protein KRZ98_16940 [Sphingobium sp. AS12]|uniref:hypothetical protein n=1 Tax=Sphingobium sp. AS12 TaxID=2849495 RepID=UPI000CAA4FC6|nr:hypothetical protein [Sphingobium sp. AS12]MBV2149932.1 hypothetical protein [Sphingobium sp. AS12]PKP94703.1 MAG: hypothetical protein CVT77_01440 [Alphaproteobacteria bacterium HGW-Alphaproteobacteria-16]